MFSLAHPLAVRDEHGDEPAAGDEDLRERGPAVAEDRVGDDRGAVRATVGEHDREARTRSTKPAPQTIAETGRRAPRGEKTATSSSSAGRREQRERRREREPVDVRLVDHGASRGRTDSRRRAPGELGTGPCPLPNECPLIASGQAESASRIATSGTTHRELAAAEVERRLADGRPDVPVEHGRDQPQHVHRGEHDRDGADDRPAPALLEDAGEDRGTRRRSSTRAARRASSCRPSSARSRARAGRAPSRRAARARRSPCAARPSPASRNIAIEISPWLTIWSTAPLKPRSLTAKRPNMIRPICASDE